MCIFIGFAYVMSYNLNLPIILKSVLDKSTGIEKTVA